MNNPVLKLQSLDEKKSATRAKNVNQGTGSSSSSSGFGNSSFSIFCGK